MHVITAKRVLIVIIAVFSLSLMIGCAGREYAHKDPYPYMYYHKELPEADRAIEAARQAGKERECPAEFKAAEDLKNRHMKAQSAYRRRSLWQGGNCESKCLCSSANVRLDSLKEIDMNLQP
jgi:hypothetical protein